MMTSVLKTPRIHLVERVNNIKRINGDMWDSGDWYVSEETAKKLVGGDLYVHTTQDAESHFGGKIISFSIGDKNAAEKQRIVFRIQFTPAHRGVRAGRGDWGQEKKIVLE